MLYAIGEITLVVIGILIALQINNWNELQKNNALEKEYYCRLLEDVLVDDEQIADLLIETESRLEASNQAARLLQNEVSNKKDVAIAMNRGLIGVLSQFRPSDSAFEDLKSGANLNIIRDKEIVKALNNYYHKVEALNYISINHANNMVEIWYSHRDKFASGWIHGTMHSDRFLIGMEQDVYDNVRISDDDKLSTEMKFDVYNDALTFISSNYRRMELCQSIQTEIDLLLTMLGKKCQR